VTYPDLLCLCHLRWNFVFQRPQHLMTRFAAVRRVYFLEEPVFGSALPLLGAAWSGNVCVLTPQLPDDLRGTASETTTARLLQSFLREEGVEHPVLWLYTPMMLPLASGIRTSAVVYDCMDELSAFAYAPPELAERERALLERADLVFTGGQSLYEVKRKRHPRVHAFPSSVDVAHFSKARAEQPDPHDQVALPHPRIGYCGVIDERMDFDLIAGVASRRPDWQIIMIGPTAKVAPHQLPRAGNIHYLGMKAYDDLPEYLAGWDVAMLPFARNEATRYISPTKTPEYLAAGLPVVSTSVRDVVRPYGEQGLVRIADTADAFVTAAEAALVEGRPPAAADRFLAKLSWDRTWAAMNSLLDGVIHAARVPVTVRLTAPVLQPSPSLGSTLAGEA
jgi:glycosyltransferase involved in cell wall biosynthesis